MNINKNREYWGIEYKWKRQGEEWSESWGNSKSQWFSSIYPRIQKYLPCNNILEIACGYGRWTHFLKNYCERLFAIDLAEECIEVSKSRFKDKDNIEFFVNDGKSLDMIVSSSIDFIYSFDSLVHANPETVESYLSQFDRILKKDGVAFIHHSNLRAIAKFIGTEYTHLRDHDVDAQLVSDLCEKYKLSCIAQELVNWGMESLLLDCFSTITRKSSKFYRENLLFENSQFMHEAQLIKNLSKLYS
jgi:ubiquinone/menaquinone biosynthesis C-methylase UbiE